MILNTRLKTIREIQGLTQVEVAKKSGISERQYIRFEKGERDPRAAITIRISRALNITVEDLFGAQSRQEQNSTLNKDRQE